MNWRMEAQSFTNDTVEDGEFLHFFICHRAKSSVRIREIFQLFLIQSLAEMMVNWEWWKLDRKPYATAGLLARCIMVQATLEELVC